MNWLLIGAPAIAAVAGILALSSCRPDPRIQEQHDAALTGAAQSNVNTAVPKIAEQSATKTLHIEVTAKEAVRAVQVAPGADAPLAPDVLAAWSTGVDRVRAQALAAHAGPVAGPGPSGLPQPVPAP